MLDFLSGSVFMGRIYLLRGAGERIYEVVSFTIGLKRLFGVSTFFSSVSFVLSSW